MVIKLFGQCGNPTQVSRDFEVVAGKGWRKKDKETREN